MSPGATLFVGLLVVALGIRATFDEDNEWYQLVSGGVVILIGLFFVWQGAVGLWG